MTMDLGIGIIIGLLMIPCLTAIDIAGTIVVNAIRATNTCKGDCQQGRVPCNCKGVNELKESEVKTVDKG